MDWVSIKYGGNLIRIRKLIKKYGKLTALKSISIDIEQGDFWGILGPNGAGKTTLINILNTLSDFDSGKVTIKGMELKENRSKIKSLIGVIPQEIALYEELSAYENLMFWGKLYGINSQEIRERTLELLQMVGLDKRKNDLVKIFSGGMKRRLNIAVGLIHNPMILLLDEPTVGIDPQSRNFIFEILMNLHSVGKTIIYTTHYMEEAEKLCDKIAIINEGKIIAMGNKDDLLSGFDVSELNITFDNPIEKFGDIVGYDVKQRDAYNIVITGKNIARNLQNFLNMAESLGANVKNITYSAPNLEKLFLHLTGKNLRD